MSGTPLTTTTAQHLCFLARSIFKILSSKRKPAGIGRERLRVKCWGTSIWGRCEELNVLCANLKLIKKFFLLDYSEYTVNYCGLFSEYTVNYCDLLEPDWATEHLNLFLLCSHNFAINLFLGFSCHGNPNSTFTFFPWIKSVNDILWIKLASECDYRTFVFLCPASFA